MLHKWRFLTGSLPELKRVWRAYGIAAAVVNGSIDHTPATYVIDSRGRFSRLFVTSMSYSSVDLLGYEIARSMAALLPGHPRLHGAQPLGVVDLLGPRSRVTLPRAGGGSVRLGPGSGPHLVLFFDTWETEVADLNAQLQALNAYRAAGKRGGSRRSCHRRGQVEARPRHCRTAAQPAAPAHVSGRDRRQRPRRGRVPGAGLALARARLRLGPVPLLPGPRRKGWPTQSQLLARCARRSRTQSKGFGKANWPDRAHPKG